MSRNERLEERGKIIIRETAFVESMGLWRGSGDRKEHCKTVPVTLPHHQERSHDHLEVVKAEHMLTTN